ncbi:autotransporter domain-containing protein [Lacinutrix neustonica]|uniref:Autotransporter domain-containing protein n=1 Tax=Lacinutrix neustonica TaxID=2980107 RepID=A0A9E8N058_9FLAO|nr:outer membrane beta-barrel protein [Lacinutrix neustonica]WAC03464.1 autotransporter domain-containing protein [Lacinutrix neustonica]
MTHLKSMLTLVITVITFSTFAQDGFTPRAQGNFLANGSIGIISTSEKAKFEGTTSDVGSTFQITATPKVGYFITDNIVAGLEIEVRTSTTKFEGIDEKVTSDGIAVGPFAGYMFDNGLFAEATVGFGSNKTSTIIGDIESSVFAIRGTAGYAFFFGDHISVEPAINYTNQSQKPKGGDGDNKTILNTIFFSAGFTAYF